MPFPSPGDLPDPGIELTSPALAGVFVITELPGKPYLMTINMIKIKIRICRKMAGARGVVLILLHFLRYS